MTYNIKTGQDFIADRPKLALLIAAVEKAGHDIYLVGGVVRDLLLGVDAKDIDLATSARPNDVADILTAVGFDVVPTGIDHGTVTAVVSGTSEGYEITTFRQDISTDGRRATVAFSDNMMDDAARRDFTFNAMYLDSDGFLFDFFNGEKDLKAGTVRFVGEADERIKEDFLRILRFFRFNNKFDFQTVDSTLDKVIADNVKGLADISRERVWAEFQKILVGKRATTNLAKMKVLGVMDFVDGNVLNINDFKAFSDPVLALASMVHPFVADLVADNWKLSNDDRKVLTFVTKNRDNFSFKMAVMNALLKPATKKQVFALADFVGDVSVRAFFNQANVPVFPVDGNDLVAVGLKGKDVGDAKAALMNAWVDSDFTADKDSLMKDLASA